MNPERKLLGNGRGFVCGGKRWIKIFYPLLNTQKESLCLDELIQWVCKDWVNDVQCAGFFSTSGIEGGCLLFWGDEGILVHLGFLWVWSSVCKLSSAAWKLGSCHPCISFQIFTAPPPISSSHFPENQSQFWWPIWDSKGTILRVTYSNISS